jgi:hypothetical protein
VSRLATASSLLVLPAIAAGALWALSRAVAFDPTSYAAWGGIVITLLALAALVKPARWLWLPTRRRALLAICAGAAITVAALAWPARVTRSAGPHQRLDDFLSEYQAVEYHEARTRAPLTRVADAVREVSLADMPAAELLIWLRSLGEGPIHSVPPEDRSLLDTLLDPGTGFLPLDVSDQRDRVYGMVGTPWTGAPAPEVHTAEAFLAYRDPGAVRVAFDFRLVEEGDGWVRLSTETRILGTDPAARRTFARYWRLVYPGSAIIRRVWLDAIVARAERPRP